MPRASRWWAEPRSSAEDRARWLGLFPRPVRLRVRRARRRALAPPALGQPAWLGLPVAPAPDQPPAVWDWQLGQPRALRLAPPVLGVAGTVDLSWRDLAAGSLYPAAWAPPDVELPDERPAGYRAGVPLWKRLAYLLKPPTDLLLSADGPIEWPATLHPYQVEGVKALLARDALLLADDMGLGKTIQAIAALRILALQRQVQRALVVVPAGLVGQWQRALRQWAPELRVSTIRGPALERAWQWKAPAHVSLTSYETLREDFTPNPQSPPRRRVWDLVVLDEAQRIKAREAEVSRVCKQLKRHRAWALSGTPLENSLEDLASILEFVQPRRDDAALRRALDGASLRAVQQRVQLRRRKADVLPQLPPKTTTSIRLQLAGAQQESYERAERDGIVRLRERGESLRIENVLELIVRLKQLCNLDPASGRSAKLDDLAQRLATLEAEGHRALVFTQFADATYGARALAERLARFQPLVYTGALSAPQREAVVERFKQDPRHRLLILSLRAGGQGLNLQEASYVFHFDRWWNPAVERQAEDRSHRLGQVYPVHVYSYTCEGTIEARIEDVLRAKQRLFDELVDEVTLDLGAALTLDELVGLFGLAPPRAGGSRAP